MIVPLAWQKKHLRWNRDKNSNFVDDAIDRIDPRKRVDILVCLNHVTRTSDLDWLATKGSIGVVAKFVPVVHVRNVRVREALALGRDDRVAHVELDRPFYPMTDVSVQNMRVQNSLFYGSNTFEGQCPGIDGSGTNIAVIDSGVDDPGGPPTAHGTFPAAAFGFDALANTVTNPDDNTIGHGTHVAGIALGRPLGGFRGVAKGAGLVDVRVFAPSQPTTGSTILQALNTCISQRVPWNIGVINMSLGDCTPSDGNDAVSQNVNAAVSAGILVTVSMGNSTNCSVPPGTVRVQSPAAADEALTVQASSYQTTVDRTDDTVATNLYLRGPRLADGDGDTADEQKPEVTAPGTNTNATVSPRGVNSAKLDTTGSYWRKQGTSMAAPHVAGLAALLMQANPNLVNNPLTTKQLILTTAEHKGSSSGWQSDWGLGLVDGVAACQAASAPPVTDLKFVANCGSPSPASWLSPDLVPGNPFISESVLNSIQATITNGGTSNAGAFQVELGVHDFSNSNNASYVVICTVPVSGLAAGASTTVSCSWLPNVSATTGMAHACLKAKIIYPGDSDGSNDCAQHNVDIVATHSPAEFQFAVVNTTAEDLRIGFQTDLNACNAGGWKVRLPEGGFVLRSGEPPRMVRVVVDPGEVASGAKVVNVGVIGTGPRGKRWDLGGVALVAQLPKITDCNGNKVDDAADVAIGASKDRNGNKVPDECDALACPRRSAKATARGLHYPIPQYPDCSAATAAAESKSSLSSFHYRNACKLPDGVVPQLPVLAARVVSCQVSPPLSKDNVVLDVEVCCPSAR